MTFTLFQSLCGSLLFLLIRTISVKCVSDIIQGKRYELQFSEIVKMKYKIFFHIMKHEEHW